MAVAGARSFTRALLPPAQESTNGVFVNDFKVEVHALREGDVVQFGGAADIAVGTRFDGPGNHLRSGPYSPLFAHLR